MGARQSSLNPSLGEYLAWATLRRRRYRVSGDSMRPLLCPGDQVFVRPADHVVEGDIVVARHPFRNHYVIKRVSNVVGDRVTLTGDNPQASTDSATYGDWSLAQIIGVVTAKL